MGEVPHLPDAPGEQLRAAKRAPAPSGPPGDAGAAASGPTASSRRPESRRRKTSSSYDDTRNGPGAWAHPCWSEVSQEIADAAEPITGYPGRHEPAPRAAEAEGDERQCAQHDQDLAEAQQVVDRNFAALMRDLATLPADG